MSNAYQMYNALRLHFNSENYDYFKYSGKTNCKFIPENQRMLFDRLQKKYDNELLNFYLSNFLKNPKVWINDLFTEECEDIYKEFQKKNQSLSYIFKNDIDFLLDKYSDLNEVLRVKNDYPILLKLTMQEKVSLDTLLILDMMVRYMGNWDKKIGDDVIWNNFKFKCVKYRPFMNVNLDKMKDILKREVKNIR